MTNDEAHMLMAAQAAADAERAHTKDSGSNAAGALAALDVHCLETTHVNGAPPQPTPAAMKKRLKKLRQKLARKAAKQALQAAAGSGVLASEAGGATAAAQNPMAAPTSAAEHSDTRACCYALRVALRCAAQTALIVLCYVLLCCALPRDCNNSSWQAWAKGQEGAEEEENAAATKLP